MPSNLEEYEKELERLIKRGQKLLMAAYREFSPETFNKFKLPDDQIKEVPSFSKEYKSWYSESLAVISQVIPERIDDFRSFYSPKLTRKEITFANYTISDALRGLRGTLGERVVFDQSAAIEPMNQQLRMVDGLKKRFRSKLFDIRTLVHAELLDDEIAAADYLNKNGFQRGAGAIAGVVLEGHLTAVCNRHSIALKRKDPTISDLNEALKSASVTELSQWRFIQHLGDIRNKCDHKKTTEPTATEVQELIDGVRKITKTVL